MRGAAIEVERYTTQEIAERDNWTCHLCKRKVTKRQLPHAHPRSATIDHLVPVSAGGDDVRANVALAHWSCNAARSDTGAAQLRLMG
jgi:5-methylcytosine-specific restriction endonuclease McrA